MARKVRNTHDAQLRDPDVATTYLTEALEDGDKAVIQMALNNIDKAHEETGYSAEVRASIKRGLEDLITGRIYTHEQVKRHFDIEE